VTRRCGVARVAIAIVLAGIGMPRAAAQSGYVSPFSIAFVPDIGAWTSDFSARRGAIDANTTPAMTAWYSTTVYSDTSYPKLRTWERKARDSRDFRVKVFTTFARAGRSA
jgi:hypothetical protein